MTSASSALSNMNKFDEMEEKINRKLDEAEAMATLNNRKESDAIEALTAKYDDGAKAAAVDAELAALKASMGLAATAEDAQQ